MNVVSSDGVVFKVSRKYLEAATAGFPSFEAVLVDQQSVALQEPSEVLELLFQFMHPRSEDQQFRQTSVMEISPNLFFEVAEAAEKYLMFGAVNLFVPRMH